MNPILQLLQHLFSSQGGGMQQPGMQGGMANRGQSQMGGILPLLLAFIAHQSQQGAQQSQQRPGGAQRGNPRAQGFRGTGGTQTRRDPNQGGHAGPRASETTSPGMALQSLLGNRGSLGGGAPGMYGSGNSLSALPRTMV